MRMRKKANTPQRLEEWGALRVMQPDMRGCWTEYMNMPNSELRLEIGCGKGRFIVDIAQKNPNIAFVAMEKNTDVIVLAMGKANEAQIKNVRFILGDAANLETWFAPGELSVIYTLFSDPWPRNRWQRRRLTHPDFLARYHSLLRPSGIYCQKTDNDTLYEFSRLTIPRTGFHVLRDEPDLYAGLPRDENHLPITSADWPFGPFTEYEKRFLGLGQPIHGIYAQRDDDWVVQKEAIDE